MPFCDLDQLRLHYRDEGDPSGPALVLSHALGTDLTLWDGVVARLPPELRVIRFDTRGHGQSDCPAPPYAMGALIRDAESLLDHLGVRDCVFAGLSMGGMIAQGLAVKRLDQIRALVLSNTAARIATAALWQDRIAQVEQGGMAAIIAPTLARWFPPRRRDSAAAERCRAWMMAQDPQGYI
ncbi:alpha/beta fold hydrolase, partial [Thioclava sp. BHET1]